LSVAELLGAQGAGVVVNGRDADAAAEAARGIAGAVAFPGSPSEPALADALIDTCIKEFGQIDILVNCAGTAGLASESILTVTSAQFHDLLDAHLGTTFETCRAAAPKMVEQGSGSIINTSSFAFLGDYGGTGYPAGKGGVNGFTMAIAAELKEYGVRANVVCALARRRGCRPGRSTRATSPTCTAVACWTTQVCRPRSTRPHPSTSRRHTPISPAISRRT
jgi:NAD(P)-dependent dehydrogenase (short-subunit alcohol dehydrogenase family)